MNFFKQEMITITESFVKNLFILVGFSIFILYFILAWFRARLCKLQKRCTRLAAASDKVYQLIAHGRLFSPGTPA
jgi:hypothetical protein